MIFTKKKFSEERIYIFRSHAAAAYAFECFKSRLLLEEAGSKLMSHQPLWLIGVTDSNKSDQLLHVHLQPLFLLIVLVPLFLQFFPPIPLLPLCLLLDS